MKRKTYIYNPSMTEDFAQVKVHGKPIPSDFKFIHKNPIWRFFAWCFYYLFAIPILGLYSKIMHRTKVENKKEVMRQLKDTGFFIYSNHTMLDDGWNHAVFTCWPRKTYIVSLGNTLNTNIFLTFFVSQLGAVPLPSDFKSARNFMKCLEKRLDEKAAVVVYPEGTIWPYYTKARVTKKGAFKYPRVYNKPVVFACTTFRKPKGFLKKFKKPRVVITLSDPIFPSRNPVEKIDEIRLQTLYDEFIEKTVSNKDNYAAYNYVQGEIEKDYLDDHFDEAYSSFQEEDEKKDENKDEKQPVDHSK